METSAFENVVAALRQLDTNHEFDALLGDSEKLKQLQTQTSAELQKTLDYLSEFGHLKAVTDKLKRVKQEAQEGKLTYENLRKSIQTTAGVSTDELLEIYNICHTLFLEGKFEKAAAVATLLSYVNPEISAFWRMTGACYWNMGDQKSALAPFLYAAMVNSLEVDNHLAALDCLIQLGFVQEALNYYNTAKEVLSDVQQWDDVKKLDLQIAKI